MDLGMIRLMYLTPVHSSEMPTVLISSWEARQGLRWLLGNQAVMDRASLPFILESVARVHFRALG